MFNALANVLAANQPENQPLLDFKELMNIEQLCRSIKENYDHLRDKRKALLFLRYQFELLAWKRQKLKLGAIVFEIKELVYGDILLAEEVDIRYIRQDTTKDDELKIENRLKALGWKWDFKNIGAFAIVFLVACVFVYFQIYLWYCENLPTLAYRDPDIDEMVKESLDLILKGPSLSGLRWFALSNYLLMDTVITFCINFDLIM